MYIEETEAEEILSKEKLIDSICDTINNFNSKDIGNENFNLGFRYAIYKVSNLFEEKDKEIERLNNIIDKAIEYMKYNATSNYFDKGKNMFRREIDLLDILKGEDKE